jgi:hypothetical protein
MTDEPATDRIANQLAIPSETPLGEHWRTAQLLARSHYFHDTDPDKPLSAERAFTKILAGDELGFGPIASLRGIFIVKDQVTYSANIIAAAIQKSGRYRYRVQLLENDGCVLVFFERTDQSTWLKVGESTFDDADRKAAGLGGTGWQHYPRNMYFARALTNGARWYCPDIFSGAVYTPDEMGATIDDDGALVEVPSAPPPSRERTEQLAQRHREIFDADEERDAELENARKRNANLLQLAYDSGVIGLPKLTAKSNWTIQQIEEANTELGERIKSHNADLDQQAARASGQTAFRWCAYRYRHVVDDACRGHSKTRCVSCVA